MNVFQKFKEISLFEYNHVFEGKEVYFKPKCLKIIWKENNRLTNQAKID